MICTFFGNKDAPQRVENDLKKAIVDLIGNYDVNMFYVGNQGNFDFLVVKILKELKLMYPHIDYVIILAYRPDNKHYDINIELNSVFPEDLVSIHPKFAIDRRNKWMIEKSGFVICYVRKIGCSAKYKELAIKKGKRVIELAN